MVIFQLLLQELNTLIGTITRQIKIYKRPKGYMFPLEKDYLGNTIILNSKNLILFLI